MKIIPLTQNKETVIDDSKLELVSQHKWCALKIRNFWYAVTNYKGRLIYMHRLIINAPEKCEVDHKNRNSLDNRIRNLRLCTTAQNQHNSYTRTPNKKSQYKGITYEKATGRWYVRIRQNGKQIYIGTYDDEIEAAKIYDQKAKEIYGEFAYLNFPNE